MSKQIISLRNYQPTAKQVRLRKLSSLPASPVSLACSVRQLFGHSTENGSGLGGKHHPSSAVPECTAECEAALAFVWQQYDYPSAERLHGEVAEAIRIFVRDGMWQYSQEATQLLLDMSLISMKRRTTAMTKQRGATGRLKRFECIGL